MRSLSLRPDDLLTILKMALSIGIRNSISLLSAIQATRPLTITLVGLSPTEHTSFSGHATGQADFPHPALGKDAHQRTKLWHVTPSTTSEHNRGVSRRIVNPHVLCCFLRWSLTEAPSLHRHYSASSVLRASPSPHTAQPDSHELLVDPNCNHRWGFPCCYWSTLHVCRRYYPGRSVGTDSLVLSHQRRPSRLHGGLAPALIVSRPAQRSLHVTAYMLAKSPK
jgi:hypothetical protein